MRISKLNRTTKETSVDVELNLDGAGNASISTGIGFFDHMLNLFAAHGQLIFFIDGIRLEELPANFNRHP